MAGGRKGGWRAAAVAVAVAALWLSAAVETANGDFATDQTECADALVGLSTCLTYVEGTAKAPTPDCCAGLKQVMAKSPKCLCILIKDRNNPQLGLKIDANRSMSLPSVCNVRSNISHCPALLNLDPNSKEAAIFTQFGGGSTKSTNATTSIESGVPSSSTLPSGGHSAGDQPTVGSASTVGAHLLATTLVWISSLAALLLT